MWRQKGQSAILFKTFYGNFAIALFNSLLNEQSNGYYIIRYSVLFTFREPIIIRKSKPKILSKHPCSSL